MKRPPPSQQQRPRKAVSPCRCRDLAGTLKALHNDLELLLLRPPPSPACVHHLKLLDLGAAPISVHRDRFLIPMPLRKAAAAGGVLWIDAVQLCCFDQRSNTRPVDRPLIVAG